VKAPLKEVASTVMLAVVLLGTIRSAAASQQQQARHVAGDAIAQHLCFPEDRQRLKAETEVKTRGWREASENNKGSQKPKLHHKRKIEIDGTSTRLVER